MNLGISGSNDLGAGELGGEADHEASKGLVAVEAAVVGADPLGSSAVGSGGVEGHRHRHGRAGEVGKAPRRYRPPPSPNRKHQ